MAVSICMVPLATDVDLALAEIASHLAQAWSSLPEIDVPVDSSGTASFTIGLANVILGKMSSGIPWSELEGPCSTATLWPNAADELREHAAHVIVTVSAELDEVAMSTLLTQVTASLLAVCVDSLGVYWGNAAKLIRKDIFVDFATQVLPSGPPMYLWMDCRVGIDSSSAASGFTTGMKALGHMELEARQVPESPEELVDRMMSVGRFLIENGPVIKDGDTIGQDAGEKIRVVYSESLFGHQNQVMRLIHDQASS